MIGILQNIRATNSTKEKQQILEDNKHNKELQQVLKLTYDLVTHNYGLSLKTINHFESTGLINLNFEMLADELLTITSSSTGNKRIKNIQEFMFDLTSEQGDLIKMIIDRSLKLGIGKTIIN